MLNFVLGFVLRFLSLVVSLCLVITVANVPMGMAAVLSFPKAEGLSLSVVADNLNLRATGRGESGPLRISMNAAAESHYEVVNEQNGIRLRKRLILAPSPEGQVTPTPTEEPQVEISGPSIPLNVKLKSGKVQIQGWEKELFINIFSGSVLVREGKGSLTMLTQKASLNVQKHGGNISIDSYGGGLQLKDVEGDLSIESFMGDLKLDGIMGNIKVSASQAPVRVTGGEGQVHLDMSRGSFNSQQFKGRIEGEARETEVLVKMHPESDVNLKTKSGSLSVQSAPGVGPYVSLFAAEGDISTPYYLKVQRDASGRYARGRIRGGAAKGSVVLRAVDGSLSVR